MKKVIKIGEREGNWKMKKVIKKKAYQEWDENTVAEEMAKALGVGVDDIEVEEEREKGVYFWEVTLGDKEWIVFESYEDAERYAVDYVWGMIEAEQPISELAGYAYVTDIDKRLVSQDAADSYVEGLDDDEAAEEAGLGEEYDEAAEAENYDEMYRIVEEAREIITERISDEWYLELDRNPIRWLVDEQGLYSSPEEINFLLIDYEEAAKDAVRIDGVEHFLAEYSGQEETTLAGLFYYRTK
jgi:hypothetical protein